MNFHPDTAAQLAAAHRMDRLAAGEAARRARLLALPPAGDDSVDVPTTRHLRLPRLPRDPNRVLGKAANTPWARAARRLIADTGGGHRRLGTPVGRGR